MNESAKLRTENEDLRRLLTAAQAENALLRQKIDAMAKRMFGKKSEQLDPAQRELLLRGLEDSTEEPEGEADEDPAPRKPKKRRRNGATAIKTPENLEVVDEVIIPEWVQANPEDWKQIGQEESKRLDFQPSKVFWRRTIRPKYVHRTQRELPPLIAAVPKRISYGGLACAGLLAHLLVSRFSYHLPYYRQQQMFWSQNKVWISRQQMVQWTEQSVALLEGIVEVMRKEFRQKNYIQVDETSIRYINKEKKGQCSNGWMWVGLDPGEVVVFDWVTSRGVSGLIQLIGEDFEGDLGVDGFSVYPSYAKNREGVHLMGCWAHARRKFTEATEEDPRVAGWILNQMALLYELESRMRSQGLSATARRIRRESSSQMIVSRLYKGYLMLKARYRPSSAMGKAIQYSLNQWPNLKGFIKNGQAEIDNNLVENSIRPSALGKKNWLFIGHPDAGRRAAVIYSLTETCRMLEIDPYEYLKDVLERLPSTTNQEVHQLTPSRWLKSRSASQCKAA